MLIDDINAKIAAAGASVEFDMPTYLKESVGVPRKLLDAIRKEDDDDWTFIIRIHALIEAGLNHMLLVALGRPELRKIISKMPTASGKLEFIKALNLMPDGARKFIGVLSTLRNAAVHDITNFDISLRDYEKRLTPAQLKEWRLGLGFGKVDEPLVISEPRFAIFHGCMLILTYALKHELDAVTKRQREARRRETDRVEAEPKKH